MRALRIIAAILVTVGSVALFTIDNDKVGLAILSVGMRMVFVDLYRTGVLKRPL